MYLWTYSAMLTAIHNVVYIHMQGIYTYLSSGCGRNKTEGGFRALQRGFIHWASGRLDRLKVNCRHPHFCHICCNMTPSMKAGIYHVYLLLGKEGQLATIDKATCECAAG